MLLLNMQKNKVVCFHCSSFALEMSVLRCFIMKQSHEPWGLKNQIKFHFLNFFWGISIQISNIKNFKSKYVVKFFCHHEIQSLIIYYRKVKWEIRFHFTLHIKILQSKVEQPIVVRIRRLMWCCYWTFSMFSPH